MTKKLKIFLNYFVGPVLFLWLSYSIYHQVKSQGDVQQSWHLIRSAFTGEQNWKLLLALLLMPLNWGIEAEKWRFLVKDIQKVSFFKAYRAIFAGQAIAFSMPNRVGESAGRSVYLDEGNRIRGIAQSLAGSMSQIIVTFVLGIAGLYYTRAYILDATHQLEGLSVFWLDGLIYALTTGITLFIVVYFRISWFVQLIEKIPIVARHRFFIEKLEGLHWKELTKILLLSAARYVVFVGQYVLLLQVFEVGIGFSTAIPLICVMFLVMAIIPTIALAELGFRGKVSIMLFGMMSANTLGIIATAAGIWIINLIIPAIIGTVFILGLRLFRNKQTT
ncbi:lysylphosphatidylglycerol synthase domain-containing protein [Sediminibacterium ginsengisoli]|uniref:Lysylphosphatidylglycerol synthase TM region n=1 Tax=Sediminibacterium ginsengisoli TaxID=413434 RepID=A0A1T4JY67_9BACT|nr:lysylphosphatidylglycerol synthase domain-containing protein [Sediminibacterium ginsengisoli]SJZ34965.1 Lysylphosphatidylglycerol synthase TM region [Sediminibacterium ginsengisoli]